MVFFSSSSHYELSLRSLHGRLRSLLTSLSTSEHVPDPAMVERSRRFAGTGVFFQIESILVRILSDAYMHLSNTGSSLASVRESLNSVGPHTLAEQVEQISALRDTRSVPNLVNAHLLVPSALWACDMLGL